jgi:type VI protein secretion system component VasK
MEITTDKTPVTAAAEVAGKLVLSQGLTSSFRPKKYYTIPRETLEACLEDVEQFINFFVIEFQRVLFAENVIHTIAAFTAAVLSYWLIKVLPFWGLSLIAVSCVYLGPLIYMTNKDLIDEQLQNASNVVNSQTQQVRNLAGHHTARASETVKAYAGDYTSKAQEYIGSARGTNSKSMANAPVKSEPGSGPNYSPSDFPHAPKQEPTAGVTPHQEQYEKSQFGGQAVPAS